MNSEGACDSFKFGESQDMNLNTSSAVWKKCHWVSSSRHHLNIVRDCHLLPNMQLSGIINRKAHYLRFGVGSTLTASFLCACAVFWGPGSLNPTWDSTHFQTSFRNIIKKNITFSSNCSSLETWEREGEERERVQVEPYHFCLNLDSPHFPGVPTLTP